MAISCLKKKKKTAQKNQTPPKKKSWMGSVKKYGEKSFLSKSLTSSSPSLFCPSQDTNN